MDFLARHGPPTILFFVALKRSCAKKEAASLDEERSKCSFHICVYQLKYFCSCLNILIAAWRTNVPGHSALMWLHCIFSRISRERFSHIISILCVVRIVFNDLPVYDIVQSLVHVDGNLVGHPDIEVDKVAVV